MSPGKAGTPGFTTTARVRTALVPHEFAALTLILPFCPLLPELTVIEVVPCPLVILQPGGTVQV